MYGGLPEFPNDGGGPTEDGLWPLFIWVAAVVVLQALPFFGVECLFGWCVVQSDMWIVYAFGIALPFLLVPALIFWVWSKFG